MVQGDKEEGIGLVRLLSAGIDVKGQIASSVAWYDEH